MFAKRFGMLLVLFTFVCVLMVVCRAGDAGQQKEISLAPEELAKNYGSGAAAFNKKYEGKVLVVRGIIEDPDVEAVLT